MSKVQLSLLVLAISPALALFLSCSLLSRWYRTQANRWSALVFVSWLKKSHKFNRRLCVKSKFPSKFSRNFQANFQTNLQPFGCDSQGNALPGSQIYLNHSWNNPNTHNLSILTGTQLYSRVERSNNGWSVLLKGTITQTMTGICVVWKYWPLKLN